MLHTLRNKGSGTSRGKQNTPLRRGKQDAGQNVHDGLLLFLCFVSQLIQAAQTSYHLSGNLSILLPENWIICEIATDEGILLPRKYGSYVQYWRRCRRRPFATRQTKKKRSPHRAEACIIRDCKSALWGEHKMTFRTSINGPGRSMIQVSCRPVIENKTHSAILVA